MDKWDNVKTNIILISGKAGVGKTTFANLLYNKIQSKYKFKGSFENGIKGIAEAIGWNREKDDKGRKLLQSIGNLGRKYNKDCWIDFLMDYVGEKFITPLDYIVIDDWNFSNEAKWFEEKDEYKVWKIKINMLSKEVAFNDTSLDKYYDYDFLVDNEESLEKLEKVADFILKQI